MPACMASCLRSRTNAMLLMPRAVPDVPGKQLEQRHILESVVTALTGLELCACLLGAHGYGPHGKRIFSVFSSL